MLLCAAMPYAPALQPWAASSTSRQPSLGLHPGAPPPAAAATAAAALPGAALQLMDRPAAASPVTNTPAGLQPEGSLQMELKAHDAAGEVLQRSWSGIRGGWH
jgi:hypothetical protein